MSSFSGRKKGNVGPQGVEMPEPEFANLEAKTWLPSRRTALAHFDFKDPKAKTSCINEELYAGVGRVVYSCDYVKQFMLAL